MSDTDLVARRLRRAFDLAEAGLDMKRENLRRSHPDASGEEIERMLRTWLRRRPPDYPGRPRALPTS